MTKTYFNNVKTLEELRKQYKKLLKKYYPDNPNGDTKATQEINAEYEKLFNILKDNHGNKAGSNYNFDDDEKLRATLEKIINLSGITIEIMGFWIWVSGSTYQFKEYLKKHNFKYASQKKMWYWHAAEF